MSGFASVVLLHASFVHQDRTFTYAVPDGIDVAVGSVVRVPLAGSRTTGVVVELLAESDVPRTVPLAGLAGPGIDAELVALARWTADRYLSTFGEALAAALPQRVAAVEREAPRPAPARPPEADLSWLRSWRNGPALITALTRGTHAGFSLRPEPGASRGAPLVSLVSAALADGRGVLVLIPEVRVRSEVAAMLDASLGGNVAWLGSDRSARERYGAWLALRRGDVRIACGGRAAVFAPVRDLGLVLVDDESHVALKERRAPRYQSRSLAAERARRAGAVLVTVGVPPSIEVAHAVEQRRMTAVEPPRSSRSFARPPVAVADLAKQPERLVPSGRAIAAAKRTLENGGRVAVLTHRGGDEPARIFERAVRTLKPKRPALLDARSTDAALRRALAGSDVVVATPVIAKDLSFERLGLLAICHADAALSNADFRTPEEAFSTWWRIARFAESVVIETAQPDHPAVRALVRFDPDSLARGELERRRSLGYPPFAGLARIATAPEHADAVAKEIEAAGGTVLGPAMRGPLAVLAVKAPTRPELERLLRPLAEAWRAAGADVRIDIDPRELL